MILNISKFEVEVDQNLCFIQEWLRLEWVIIQWMDPSHQSPISCSVI
jgi:hypothetical protein